MCLEWKKRCILQNMQGNKTQKKRHNRLFHSIRNKLHIHISSCIAPWIVNIIAIKNELSKMKQKVQMFFFILITFIFLAAINNRVVTELINVTEWEGRDASLQTHT